LLTVLAPVTTWNLEQILGHAVEPEHASVRESVSVLVRALVLL
jgi:hypothetical protein